MAGTAAIAAVSLIGIGASAETAAQTRRLAGQAEDRQSQAVAGANRRKKQQEAEESSKAFSKIQRQRQRALGSNTSVPASGSTALGGGALAVTGAAPTQGALKTRLGM